MQGATAEAPAGAVVPAVAGCDTLPRLFWQAVGRRGDQVAMRRKRLGIWRSLSWREYGEQAKAAGLGLVALGLRRGDVVAVASENNPEWLFTDMGALGVGGVVNGIYTTDAPRQIEYIVNDSRTRFYVAENEEQLDKVLEIRDRCPTLERIIVIDLEGLRGFSDPQVISFAELLAMGRALDEREPGLWRQEVERAAPEDLAVLIYTSGTTGPPKGAMVSHANILFQIANGLHTGPQIENGEQLSFLPLCHIAERSFSTFWPLANGAVVNFAESIETVSEDIREVAPTSFFAVPRIWEKFYSAVTLRMAEATPVGRLAYRLALAIGRRRADCRLAGRPLPPLLAAAFWMADRLVLGNVKRAIGMGRCRFLYTGAAPISPDLVRWYLALGLDMCEVYGQTESVGIAVYMPREGIRLGRIGIAAPGTEVRLGDGGEILLRGPHVFQGYLNRPDLTAETVVGGWLHTGDVGEIDTDGYFRITDRMKDIIITAGGKNITPSEIENQLKFSPYISDAVVIGDGRKFLTCLVMIDHENVATYAQEHGIPFSNFASLCRAEAVQALISREIEAVNRNLARVETIKAFRLIDRQLTAEDDELTPTMKLKRKLVNEKYRDLVESMYRPDGSK